MRPKFNQGTLYIATTDGIYLRSNRSSLRLKGKSLHNLLKRLAPLLNGQYTLEELTEGLDDARQKMVMDLVERLSTYSFIQDTGQSPHASLTETDEPVIPACYAPMLSFIDSIQTMADTHFATFRNQHLLLIGSGQVLNSMIQASLRSGVRRVTALASSPDDTALAAPSSSEEKTDFSTYDTEQILQRLAPLTWNDESEVLDTLSPYDCVLYMADRPMLAQIQMLHRLCSMQQKTFMPALVIEDTAWIGPLVNRDNDNCWECAWRRLQDNLPAASPQRSWYDFKNQSELTVSPFLTQSTMTLLANQLVFEVFRYVTQTSLKKTTHELTCIHLPTLQAEQHTFMAHPSCPVSEHPELPDKQQFLAHIRALQEAHASDPETFLKRIERSVDSRLGLFTTTGGRNFVQSPLAISQIEIANPLHLDDQTLPRTVIGIGITMQQARLRAGQLACQRYAAERCEPRRLLSLQTLQQLPVSSMPCITTTSFKGASTSEPEMETWCWALNLQTHDAHLIPASLAYPGRHNASKPDEPDIYARGVGSGMSWAEAVSMALLDWCGYLTREQIKTDQKIYPRIDPAHYTLTTSSSHLYHLLQISDARLTVYDVTGRLQVPTFAICIDDQVVAYSTHYDATEALSVGLEQALQHYQSQHTGQRAYALPVVPNLPPIQRGDHNQTAAADHPEQWSAKNWSDRQAWLQQRLQDQHLSAFAVPLDHDPALQPILPYIVRIFLVQA